MKRILTFFIILTVSPLFSSESPLKDLNRSLDFEMNVSDFNTANRDHLPAVINGMNITHIISGFVTYGLILSNTALGTAIGILTANPDYFAAQSPLYRQNLKIIHRIVAISSYVSYGITSILGFIDLAIKIVHQLPVNRIHFITSIVTSFFFLLSIVSMVLVQNAYQYPETALSPYRTEVTVFHGVSQYLFTLSFTIGIIAIPIGRKYKIIFPH